MFVGIQGVRKVLIAGAVLGVCSAVHGQSFLGSTEADYLGGHSRLFGSDINLVWSSHGNINSGSINAGSYGFMKWKDISSGPGDFNANGLGFGNSIGANKNFYTLCGQFVQLNDPSTFNVWDISGGTNAPPLPGYRPYTLFRAASVISGDYDGVGGTRTAFQHAFNYNSSLRGAGIQLAVWAAIYGDGTSWDAGDYNSSTKTVQIGGFKATDTNSSFGTVVSYAKDYYNAALNSNWGMGTQASTYWFDSQVRGHKYGQDQLTVSVPEPFTVALMGGSAFAGYLRMRRRKR